MKGTPVNRVADAKVAQTLEEGVAVDPQPVESQPFDVTTVAPADTTSALKEREPGGLGLHLIRKMVDTLDYRYENGCSTIKFTKLLGQGNV